MQRRETPFSETICSEVLAHAGPNLNCKLLVESIDGDRLVCFSFISIFVKIHAMKPALLLLGCLSTFLVYTQHNDHFKCATDEMHQSLYLDYPEIIPGVQRAYEKLKYETEHFIAPSNRSNNPYIIPVVFHIIHNYGPENISDAQIRDGIRQANLQLRKLNADTSEIVSDFLSIASDVNIELRLAQLDPDGNCTSGITRHVSPLTSIGDHQVKSIVQWPPDQYLNVYVCNQAAGLAGHALLPHAADTIPQWDGIVMQHSYVGTIGTSDYFRRTVLTHEIGHYLNLQHIWGGNNVPNYFYLPVAQASNCDHDDEVTDTPNTIGWQSCNLTSSSCGNLDNVQNYMDYAYCARMFTVGQRDRMHACLNSSIAGRINLWSPANLLATGTDDVTFYLCGAKFEADKRIVCVGDAVLLTDVSYHGITERSWSVPGGMASSVSDSVISVTYSQPGVYGVSLIVGNGTNQLSMTEQNYITVLPVEGISNYIIEDFEYPISFEEKWVVYPQDGVINWSMTQPGKDSPQSFFVDNFNGSSGLDYIFQAQPFDASGLTSLAVQFDYAFSRRETSNTDLLLFQLSINCGETWVTRRTFSNTTLITTQGVTTDYFEPNDSEWKTALIDNFTAAQLVDGLQMRFLFRAGGGNNMYIDNVNVGHPDELGIALNRSTFGISLVPNPSDHEIQFRGLPPGSLVDVRIIDALGRVVLKHDALNSVDPLHISHLKSGVYSVLGKTSEEQFSIRLVVP